MREPNKNHVYSLEDLTSEEHRILFNWLLENDNGWQFVSFEHWKENKESLKYSDGSWAMYSVIPTHNAKELFYTLENVQVDCRYLTNDQIDEIADIFKKYGYRIGSLFLMEEYCFIRQNAGKYCLVTTKDKNKTKITYDKFMDLFGRKEENFKKLVEVLNEELTEESQPQNEVTMIAEQPKHPSIAILDEAVELSNELKAYKETSNLERAEESFKEITNSISDLLIYKNQKYGNSALNPLDIFNGKTKVGQRIDDKLARVKNSKELRKNDIADLLGYLTLVCQENGWTNFDEFKD